MIFDSWAGMLPPNQFRRWVIEPTRAIVAKVRARYPTIPLIGFPRLAGPMLVEYSERAGVRTVAMDTAMDPSWARNAVSPEITLQGNLDPLALLAGGPALESEARAILDAMRGRPFIFNLGHGILPPTPVDHVAALVRTVRES
jgi:uroporphyrinogen decarboxylase